MRLHVADHPLIAHKLTVLRDERTESPTFRLLVDELVTLLAYEATREVRTEQVEITTPVARTTGTHLASPRPLVVPILRAGLGMVEGMLRLVPAARVGHIGLYREEDTLEPIEYYFKIPSEPEARDFIVLDPMLATGGSASAAVQLLKDAGASRIRYVCIVAAPEGVQRMLEDHPDLPIFTAALDRQLDQNGFIRPGLGDAGDRLFGTR